MRIQIKNTALALAAFFLLSGYNSCDPIIENNGFDLWCGDQLCNWEVETGAVAEVATWHKADKGVELVGDKASISQLNDVTSSHVSCMRFYLVADVEETAEAYVEMDFQDDGSVEWSRPIPVSSWAPIGYLVTLPVKYQSIRFRVRKDGPGRVKLAEIRAESSDSCTDAPLRLLGAPDGSWCPVNDDAACASGMCTSGVNLYDDSVCNECTTDADCTSGDSCGAAATEPHLAVYRACGAPGRHALGERCFSDRECATGICKGLVCSSCRDDNDCAGSSCTTRERSEEDQLWLPPHQCGPEAGGAQSGEPCHLDSDCASGTCTGSAQLSVCQLDGRTCNDDTDCPPGLPCFPVGTASGACQ